MCDAGRIRHHLKHNLWRGECTILFVGFQSPGTLGRALIEGADEVRLFGETVQVNAQIRQMSGLSGHADRDGLLTWIRHFDPKPKHVFVNHGEDLVADHFARTLTAEGIPVALLSLPLRYMHTSVEVIRRGRCPTAAGHHGADGQGQPACRQAAHQPGV